MDIESKERFFGFYYPIVNGAISERGYIYLKLKISIEKNEEIEKFILIVNLGILIALSKELINIEDAENFLYSPFSVNKLRDLGIKEEVIKLVELGCELEDVKRLIPNKLNKSINDIYNKSMELLLTSSKISLSEKKWID